MKKLLFSLMAIGVLSTFAFFEFKAKNKKGHLTEEEEGGIPLQDRMNLAWEQEREMTMDPKLGYVPSERLAQAWEYTKNLINTKTNAALGLTWNAVGPKNWGGRSRAICVDLNDPTRKTIFLGSVGGGIWKTTDITASAPNWQPINDMFGNLAISSIAQDPSNPQIMYFGTGEGYGNLDAIRGAGIWKSTNGGASWAQLSATNNSTYYYSQKVLVNNTGVLFVATYAGLYRSTNGGTSFTKVLGTGLGITGASSNFCYDVELAPNGDMYASLSGSVHKSTDGGVTWGAALTLGVTATRIEISTAPSNANYVYLLCEYNSAVQAILISTNGGATFRSKTEPTDADTGIPATDFSRTQAWYDLTIAVDPNNANILYVGAVDLFKSVDSSSTWQQISHWYGGFGFQNVHADQHNIIFNPGSSSIMYFLNDGGIYTSTNATNTIPTIVSKNTNYVTLQFYGCAMSPAGGSYNFLAGAQDNGTHKYTQSSLQNTTQVTGGDGAFCHIDQNQFQYWYSSYVYNNYYRSTDGGNTFTSTPTNNTGRFINPTDYDDVANIMYCARSNNEYLRWDNPQTGTTFTTVSLTALGGQISAIKVSPNTSNRVFMGTGTGVLLKVDNANTATPTATNISTGLPAAYISCIEVETGNDNHLLVTYSSYGTNSVWESTNGGTSWTSVEGNLPDMPIRWALFNPNSATQAMLATELGVWTTDALNGTSTVWGSSNTGLANVRVDMLQVRASDKLVIAATHGRGLYYTGFFGPATANFSFASGITYPYAAVDLINTSLNATSYTWDFGDGTTSTIANPVKIYTTPGVYNITLSINGGASTVVKAITVLPRRATPYTLAQGGNFENNAGDFAAELIAGTSWVRGNATVTGKDGVVSGSNAWITGLGASYVNNSEAYLYTPAYNFLVSGTYNFSFYTKFNCESDYDGYRIEYSTDTAKTWLPLGTTVQTNWYNSANVSATTIFPANQAFFSGAFGTTYAKKNYDVSFLSGNTYVCFRFVFKSDGGVVGVGAAIDDLEITGPPNIVPLQLLSFTAAKAGKNALLNWSTTQEINVANFLVERSFNGVNFSKMATVAAQNQISGISNYQYTDASLATTNNATAYYRITIIDKDGSQRTSQIVKLQWNPFGTDIIVSPNPFINKIVLSAPYAITKAELILADGKMVYSTTNLTNNTIQVPAQLPSGQYVLRLYTANGLVSKKIVKQ